MAGVFYGVPDKVGTREKFARNSRTHGSAARFARPPVRVYFFRRVFSVTGPEPRRCNQISHLATAAEQTMVDKGRTSASSNGDGAAAAPVKKVSVRPKAFCSMTLHASRHKHRAVHGILVGSFDKRNKTITVEDAAAVCHGAPTQPLVETAIGLLIQSKGVFGRDSIVGWYTAPTLLEDERPGPVALRMASNLATESVEPTLLVIRNTDLGSCLRGDEDGGKDKDKKSAQQVLQAYGKDFGKQYLEPLETVVGEADAASAAARTCLKENVRLADLTDHLENAVVNTSWFPNRDLSEIVDKCCK